MTDFGITPDDLRRLARLVEENGLSELRYEEGDLRVTLRTASYSPAPQNGGIHSAAPVPGYPLPAFPDPYGGEIHDEFAVAENAPPSEHGPGAGPTGVPLEAPVMGVFYRSPSPEDPPFVEVGDYVEVGQSIGMIEAMKVFSEVKAEHAGRVLAIVAQNKALVQPGDTLIILEGSTEA